jgi:hypothetical protein
MKRSIREAKTEELIEALSERKGIEYIETDESEQCEITIDTAGDALPTHRYHSSGKAGPEIILRYVPPMEGS